MLPVESPMKSSRFSNSISWQVMSDIVDEPAGAGGVKSATLSRIIRTHETRPGRRHDTDQGEVLHNCFVATYNYFLHPRCRSRCRPTSSYGTVLERNRRRRAHAPRAAHGSLSLSHAHPHVVQWIHSITQHEHTLDTTNPTIYEIRSSRHDRTTHADNARHSMRAEMCRLATTSVSGIGASGHVHERSTHLPRHVVQRACPLRMRHRWMSHGA